MNWLQVNFQLADLTKSLSCSYWLKNYFQSYKTKTLMLGSVGLLQSSKYKKVKRKCLLHAHKSRETGGKGKKHFCIVIISEISIYLE
jgi:hypothetical protein